MASSWHTGYAGSTQKKESSTFYSNFPFTLYRALNIKFHVRNMTLKIFLTGATGYIGGDTLFLVCRQHPGAELALLVRSQEKAKKVQEQYPNARIVIGSLDDSDILRREAAWADVVIRKLHSLFLYRDIKLNAGRHRRLI